MIIWARVPDRNGVVKPDPRPLVIVDVHPTVKTAPVVAHCISTRPPQENDPIFPLPWNADDGSCTGLYQWCAVVLKWWVQVDQKQIVKTSGSIPPDMFESLLIEIDRVMA